MISFRTVQHYFLLAILLVTFSPTSHGQARKSYNNISYTAIYYSPYVGDFYYSLGIHGTKYSGDYGSFIGEETTRTEQGLPLQFSLNVGYQVTNYISLRFDYTRYRFNEIKDIRPNNYTGVAARPTLKGTNVDYSLNIIHDWFPKASIDNGERRYTPYSILGLGLTNRKITGGGLAGIVPIGWGFKYYIYHNLNIAFEARAAVVLGDNIDGAQEGHPRDYYVNFGLKATWQKSYKFDYKQYKKKYYHL